MDWYAVFKEVGLPLLLLFVIGWAGHKEHWKWGTDYRKLEARCDRQEKQIDRLVELGFKAATLAEKQAESIREPGKESK